MADDTSLALVITPLIGVVESFSKIVKSLQMFPVDELSQINVTESRSKWIASLNSSASVRLIVSQLHSFMMAA